MRMIKTGLPGAEGIAALRPPIGREEIQAAHQRLLRYKTGKHALEQRLITNERWYQLRQWEYLREKSAQVEPVSAWLFNSIQNKHADAMDNYPEPLFLPREEGDRTEAQRLSSIVPVILDQCDFEEVYSNLMDDKIRNGTGVYGIFWDANALNGLGEISIRDVDLLSIFWEPGVEDIQRSRELFTVELVDQDLLCQQYPQLLGKLGSPAAETAVYITEDSVDLTGKSPVIDWYYKKRENGRTVLHYCKFCGSEVLFATENLADYAQRGLYDHGQYPFVFDPLYRVKGSPCGFGFIDVGKSAQEYIDRADQAIMENLLTNAKPRHFIRNDGSVNEEEFSDLRNHLVHVDGNLAEDSIRPINATPLGSIYYSILQGKITELKETTGNRDISTGGTSSGVTAASAIAAMQEAGSKLSRDSNKGSYRAFRKAALLVVELIRQFYDLPRQFRILGENGADTFVIYDNEGIRPQPLLGVEPGWRVPQFDIRVTAQKASAYTKMAQNELALQFYTQGFFDPARAEMALAALRMMEFDGKENVVQTISRNAAAVQTAKLKSGLNAGKLAALGGGDTETKAMRAARKRVAEAASPK